MRFSRRAFLAATGAGAALSAAPAGAASAALADGEAVAFHGSHQAGIATEVQAQLVLATFDLATSSRAEVLDLLAAWTKAAERLTQGHALTPAGIDQPPPDTGEAMGLGAARLTLTFGYGPSFFDGRLGYEHLRPTSLAELPELAGDQIDAASSGGDLCVQACADDAQVAFSAVHNLSRMASGVLSLRKLQTGFSRTSATASSQETRRNLLGFKDGTNNILGGDRRAMDRFVWLPASTEPSWMRGGSYLVFRRMRLALEAWGRLSLAEQEQVIGRRRSGGAPLGARHEHDPVPLDLAGRHGGLVVPDGAHVREAAPSQNGSVRILRRGYSFAEGVDPLTGEIDAGLIFIAYQRDPEAQFLTIARRLAQHDRLQAYATTVSQGVFACPGGLRPGAVLGGHLPR